MSSYEPKLSQLVELRHVHADSFIGSNFSTLFVKPNELLNLTCFISAPRKTEFVYWYKNKEPIKFDSPKSLPLPVSTSGAKLATAKRKALLEREQQKQQQKLQVHANENGNGNGKEHESEKAQLCFHSTSTLIIKRVQLNDTANYTCLVSVAYFFSPIPTKV